MGPDLVDLDLKLWLRFAEDPDGNELFYRGCVYSSDYDGETDYCDTATLYGTATTMCVCQGDFCNAANNSNLASYFLTAITLVVSIKLLR